MFTVLAGRDHNITAANGSTGGSDWGTDNNTGDPNLNYNNKYTEYSVNHNNVDNKDNNKKIYFREEATLKKYFYWTFFCYYSSFYVYIYYFIYNCPLALGIFFGRKSTKLTKVIEATTTTSTTTTATTTLETPSTSPQVGLLDGLGELLLNNVILKESGKVFQGFMDLLGR